MAKPILEIPEVRALVDEVRRRGYSPLELRRLRARWRRDLKRLATKAFPEPTCVICGCTEDRACPPAGCVWTRLDTATNRGVCSACA